MRIDSPATVGSEELRIQIPASGWVVGTVRKPAEESPRSVVVIHPATAVLERLYTGFAEFLSPPAHFALTIDSPGTGLPASPPHPRSLDDLSVRC